MNVLYDLEYLDLRAAGHHWITWESIHPESFPRFGDLARTWMDLILFEQVKQQGVDALFLSKSISPVWNHEALCFYQGWKVFARKHEPKTCVFSWCNDELRRAVTWMSFPSPWKCCRPALPPPLAVEKGGETTDSPSNHGVEHWWGQCSNWMMWHMDTHGSKLGPRILGNAEVLKSFSKTDILDAVFLIIFLSTHTNYYLGYDWITFSKANAR